MSYTQINWRMRVTLNDGRAMTGQMLAFDKVRNDIPRCACNDFADATHST